LQERQATHGAPLAVFLQRVHLQSVVSAPVAHVGIADDDPLDGDPGGLVVAAVVEGQVVGGEAGLEGAALVAPTSQEGEEEQEGGQAGARAMAGKDRRDQGDDQEHGPAPGRWARAAHHPLGPEKAGQEDAQQPGGGEVDEQHDG